MKRIVLLLLSLSVVTIAYANRLWVSPDGVLVVRLPTRLSTPNGCIYPAPQAAFEDAGWRLETEQEADAREAAEEAARHSQPLFFTKRSLCKVLATAGLLDTFRTWLSANPSAEFWWLTAQDLSTDDEDFVAAVAALQAATGLTDAEVRALEEAAAWGMGAE